MTEMRRIGDIGTETAKGQFMHIVTANWIFDKWYEKIILVLIMAWAIYSIGRFILW